MKAIWNFLMNLANSMAKARAATALSRMGRYDEAKRLMSEK